MYRLEFEDSLFRLYTITSRKYNSKRMIASYSAGIPVNSDNLLMVISRMINNISEYGYKYDKTLNIDADFYQEFCSFFSILNDPLQFLKLALLSEYISDDDRDVINNFIHRYQEMNEEQMVLVRQNKSN